MSSYDCPWCDRPVSEHETSKGYVHWVWRCVHAPSGWRGVFYDHPVTAHGPHTKGPDARQ